ncbi:MAG: hypothetical protein ACRDE2_05110 [Chitinophagaceae bacterium]
MRTILTISLLISLSFECFSNIYIWAGYEINKSFITQNLCVNRDDPAMHCDGKCFLNKQLEQNQQRQNDDNGTVGSKIDLLLFSVNNMPVFSKILHSSTFIFPNPKSVYLPAVYSEFFRPPRIS